VALEWLIRAPELTGRTFNQALIVFNNKIYAVGNDSRLLEWDGVNTLVAKTQDLAGSTLYNLAVHNGKLYTVQSDSPPDTGFLWEWDDVSSWVKKTFNQVGTIDVWKDLVSFNGNLYTGVDILYESQSLGEWVSVAATATPSGDGRFETMAVFNGKLYMGTHRGELFEWDQVSDWVLKAPGVVIPDLILKLLVFNSELYAITDDVGKLLKWNGTNAWTIQNPVDTDIKVTSGVVHDNDIYCAGSASGDTNKLFKFVGSAWSLVHDGNDEVEDIRTMVSFNSQIFSAGAGGGGE